MGVKRLSVSVARAGWLESKRNNGSSIADHFVRTQTDVSRQKMTSLSAFRPSAGTGMSGVSFTSLSCVLPRVELSDVLLD